MIHRQFEEPLFDASISGADWSGDQSGPVLSTPHTDEVGGAVGTSPAQSAGPVEIPAMTT